MEAAGWEAKEMTFLQESKLNKNGGLFPHCFSIFQQNKPACRGKAGTYEKSFKQKTAGHEEQADCVDCIDGNDDSCDHPFNY